MEMESHPIERQITAAEARLARALARLRALRQEALFGNYDTEAFDSAVAAYREAETEVLTARRAWAAHRTAVAPPEPEPARPIEVTPRLLFARWLVETGRLSDFFEEAEAPPLRVVASGRQGAPPPASAAA